MKLNNKRMADWLQLRPSSIANQPDYISIQHWIVLQETERIIGT